jgi:hypothetical protein
MPSNYSLNEIGYKRKNEYFGSLKWTEAFSTLVITSNVSIAKRMEIFDANKDGEKKINKTSFDLPPHSCISYSVVLRVCSPI